MSILPSDFTSFIWGIALGAIAAFGAGFLKKAGEDCYSWIRNKLSPKAPDQHASQVVIQVTRNDNVTAGGEPSPNELEPVSIERVSGVTFEEIKEAIEKAPPLQREHVASSYVGLRVEWDTYFKGGSRGDNDMIRLLLTTATDNSSVSNTIWCDVPFNEYRELGVLPAGSKIRVAGEIAQAGRWDIKLKDAHLYIYGK
jgi:hypothetical protein